MEFSTNFKRIWHSTPEVNEGPVLVEAEGYLTTEQLVNLMIKEGQELRIARAQMCDFESEEMIDENVQPDPTRAKGFDFADLTSLANGLRPLPEQSETLPEKSEPSTEPDKSA